MQDALVDSIYDYPGYNCFEDAVTGRARVFKVVRWKEYHDALRWDPTLSADEYTDEVELCFARLPGYEDLSQEEYERCMREKLAERAGRAYLGRAKLRKVLPGTLPRNSKTSTRTSHRPRVLSKDPQRRAQVKAWYFDIYPVAIGNC